MRIHPFERAINEQSRGHAAADNLEKGVHGKGLTKKQIWISHRRTEDIFVDMVDESRTWKEPVSENVKKSSKRRRRRGPKVQFVRF